MAGRWFKSDIETAVIISRRMAENLAVPLDALADELAEGEFYFYEIVGFDVVTEAGDAIGTVAGTLHLGHDLIEVRPAGGGETYDPELKGYLAAALAYLMIRQQDSVGALLFDSEIRTFIPPRSAGQHLHVILTELEKAKPASTTGLAATLHRLAERFPDGLLYQRALARELERAGLFDEAESHLAAAAERFPDAASLLQQLGELRHRRGDDDGAREAVAKVWARSAWVSPREMRRRAIRPGIRTPRTCLVRPSRAMPLARLWPSATRMGIRTVSR